MKKIRMFLGLALAVLMLFACKKEEGNAYYRVFLTDAPGDYEHVYIDVQGVMVHTNNGGWITASNFNVGVYDLLEFNNGMDLLLGTIELPAGRVSQIRLILGDDNSVVIDGETHPLSTPSAHTSGLKLNVHHELVAGQSYSIWLDFDAGQSIVETGSGSYILKPVIRVYTDLTNGKIKGIVTPMAALPTVYAIQDGDTISAIPNADGFFMISGLSGMYDVHVVPSISGYGTVELNDISVTFGVVTDLGTIELLP